MRRELRIENIEYKSHCEVDTSTEAIYAIKHQVSNIEHQTYTKRMDHHATLVMTKQKSLRGSCLLSGIEAIYMNSYQSSNDQKLISNLMDRHIHFIHSR